MTLDFPRLALLLVAGFAAGFVNTLAGGGSLLTIPALIFAGLPSTIANATNRVAIVLQSLAGSASFARARQLSMREAVQLGVPALFGALFGSFAAARIPQRIFDPVLGALLLVILATLFLKPKARAADQPPRVVPRPVMIAIFVAVGFYGGFIQAGVGFFLIAAITWGLGHDLVRTNALKLAVSFGFAVVSLVVFLGHGQIMWLPGLVLAAGNVTGALLGVRFALKRGTAAIRWVIAAAVIASALKLFGVF